MNNSTYTDVQEERGSESGVIGKCISSGRRSLDSYARFRVGRSLIDGSWISRGADYKGRAGDFGCVITPRHASFGVAARFEFSGSISRYYAVSLLDRQSFQMCFY